MQWQTTKRSLDMSSPLVMGILNVTPDSFSDGGRYTNVDDALRQVERMIGEGADIIDVGGESTRPADNRERISAENEVLRVVPVIEAVAKRFDAAVSVDTSKSKVARRALEAGAEIINDISGLRFDEKVAEVAAQAGAGLVLMHSRGDFSAMHRQKPVDDILSEVTSGLRLGIEKATGFGVKAEQIALDPGLGFSKTYEQNLELMVKLNELRAAFPNYPMLVGASRKSFIGKALGDAPVEDRLFGSVAAAVLSAWNGAHILRVHEVKETVEALRVTHSLKVLK
jgi:dihydropteroate synthase